MKFLSIMWGVILIELCISGYAEVRGEDWARYGENEIGSYHYDQQSITRPSKGIVRIWNKIIFTKKGVATAGERLGKGYEKLGYDISLREINCTDKTQRWMSSEFYSVDGEPLRTPRYDPKWEPIHQGTLTDILFQKVCK